MQGQEYHFLDTPSSALQARCFFDMTPQIQTDVLPLSRCAIPKEGYKSPARRTLRRLHNQARLKSCIQF